MFARSIDAVLRWVETTGAPNSKTPTARSCCQLLECCRHGEAALRLLRLLLRCQRGGFGCLGDLADSGAQEEHHGCSSPAPLVFECLHWGSADERAPLQNEGEARCTFSDNLKLLVQNTLKLEGLVLGCWTKNRPPCFATRSTSLAAGIAQTASRPPCRNPDSCCFLSSSALVDQWHNRCLRLRCNEDPTTALRHPTLKGLQLRGVGLTHNINFSAKAQNVAPQQGAKTACDPARGNSKKH